LLSIDTSGKPAVGFFADLEAARIKGHIYPMPFCDPWRLWFSPGLEDKDVADDDGEFKTVNPGKAV